MPIAQQSARQFGLHAIVPFVAADLPAGALAQAALNLPAGAVVTSVSVIVDTAFDANVTANIGDAAVANRYGTSLALSSAGLKAGAMTGFVHPQADKLLVTLSAASAAGAARLFVNYVVDKRQNEQQF